jgi:hypothetical protein
MNTANLTERQQQGRERHLAFRRETMQEFLKAIESAEQITRGTGCGLEKYGHDLYRIKNSVRLDLEAIK